MHKNVNQNRCTVNKQTRSLAASYVNMMARVTIWLNLKKCGGGVSKTTRVLLCTFLEWLICYPIFYFV